MVDTLYGHYKKDLSTSLLAQSTPSNTLINEKKLQTNPINTKAPVDRFPLLTKNSQPFVSILNKLGLSDHHIAASGDFQKISLDDVELVTAWSMNHHDEAVRLCDSIQQFYELRKKKQQRLISYNLGDVQPAVLVDFLRSCPIADLRQLNFTEYPHYVSKLLEYRWKSLIIADVLRESKAVLWIDSSTLFQNDSITLQQILDRETKEHQGVWLFDLTSHSIAAATNPLMFKYFNMTAQQAIDLDMWGANTMLWIGKRDVKEEVLKPFVQCSLVEDCMAPPGSILSCNFPPGPRRNYANCHRYDQAAVNVIVALRAGLNITRYTISNSVLKTSRM
ncbi:hypothetical protein Tcan_15995 [Toxocara canis]|uniref:Uncharacterized protein n=1 Tax=Toxocara canis TaxID=6265 RepID=A0A0B2VX57_TOXCA|nr:hypothetical protein Tcan_15995 [Toxocara canis]